MKGIGTVKAVVYKGPHQVSVEQVDDPRIEAPTDAILRLTSAAICGSDLHMYEGRTAAEPGMVFGHENMGIIADVGSAVVSIKKGDRVVLPFNIACGFCFNCVRGYTNACLTVNPQGVSGGYGYVNMGPFRGGQAEYVRVPFADFNCLKLPGTPGDEFEDDFILLADIFPTGYHATELAGVKPGDTVAIFGAGPVGLMTTLSAKLRGASEIYTVDAVPERLDKAKQLGAMPIDFSKGDPVEQIYAQRRNNATLRGAWRPGEDKMLGVLCGIDAVGYEAHDDSDTSKERPTQILENLVRVVNPTGRLGIIGVYMPEDPGGPNEQAKHGNLQLPWGQIWEKGLSVGMGQAPVKRYNEFLRDLIIAGRAKPSTVVTQRLPLSAAPDAYKRFDSREPGYTKVVLKPGLAA